MTPQEIDKILPPTRADHLDRWKSGQNVTDMSATKEGTISFISEKVTPVGAISSLGILATGVLPPLGVASSVVCALSTGAAMCAEQLGDLVAKIKEDIARFRILRDPEQTLKPFSIKNR